MRGDKEMRQIALRVSIALSAGVFSMMPSVSAAPVLDHVVSGGAHIDQNTPQVTKITSEARNNVIDWQDFSVAKGETVQFDNGVKTGQDAHNYLNVVSGANVSQIDGAIQGGKDVYIVNPNGVIFGNTASVDVGSLYVSSRPIDELNLPTAETTGDMQPLVNTASSTAGDIVNMGSVQADSVFVEGNNVKFMDVAEIKRETENGSVVVNNNVTIHANNIRLGHRPDTSGTYSFASVGDGENTSYTFNDGANTSTFTAIGNQTELATINSNLDGDYELSDDITITGDYTPIGGNDYGAFTGHFNGNYHTVSGITVSGKTYGGLFGLTGKADGKTQGAIIENVGVVNANINADNAGGIVGKAVDTTIERVYNEGGNGYTIYSGATSGGSGGIVGYLSSSTVNIAYNTGYVDGDSSTRIAGIAGYSVKSSISNVYNTNTDISHGLVGRAPTNDTTNVTNAYTKTSLAKSSQFGGNIDTDTVLTNSNCQSTHVADYTASLGSISNQGGVDTIWRIYEGQSLPLLRAFLTANGTVKVNYEYTQGGTTSVNNGGDDVELTYNHNDVVLSDVKYYLGTATDPFDPVKTIDKAGTVSTDGTITVDGNIYNSDLDSSGNVRAKAIFYTDQHGYDLVGNNLTMNQKEVTISSTLPDIGNINKVYDGSADVSSDKIKSLLETSSITGIVADDNTVSVDTSAVTAKFVESETTDKESPDVGADKLVKISGSITLNNAGNYANYKLSSTSATLPTKYLTGNTITQRPITVKLTKKTEINKQYNKETTVDDAYAPSAQITYDGATGVGSGDTAQAVTLSYDAAAHYVIKKDGVYEATKNVGEYNGVDGNGLVQYGGIKIKSVSGGGSSKNYKLVDEDGNTIYSELVTGLADTGVNTSGGALYAKGEITKRNIASTGFYWYKNGTKVDNPSREYNMESSYKEPENHEVRSTVTTTEAPGMLEGDSLTFTVTSAKFIKDMTATDIMDDDNEAVNAGEANGVAYTVTITGDAKGNYTIDGNDITDAGNVVIGPGSITARTINVAFSGKNAEKTYDKDALVKVQDGDSLRTNLVWSDGFLEYSGDADHKLLDDGSKIVYTGKYQKTGTEANAQDVYYNGGVQDKNIIYEAKVQNADGSYSTNYIFSVSNATTAEYNGTGVINPREITELSFNDVNKVYDTTADVKQSDISLSGASGLIDSSITAAFDLTNVTGTYLSKADGQANPDVENSGAAKSKDVAYSGISGIIKNHNYKLADSIGDSAMGEGAITALTISDLSKVSLTKEHAITKVYDSNESVAGKDTDGVSHGNDYFVGDLTYKIDDTHSVTLGYEIYDAYYKSADSNYGAANDVTYELKVSGSGNYKLDADALGLTTDGTSTWLTWGKTQTGWSTAEQAKMTGNITQADLIATVKTGTVTKTYDGSRAVMDGDTVIKDDAAVTFTGWYDVSGRTKNVEAQYLTKDVDSEEETAAGGKTVNYTIKLDDASKGNYFLKNNGNTITTVDADGNPYLTGKGHITPATLHITFGDVSKVYDGNTGYNGAVNPLYNGGIKTNADTGDADDVKLDASKYNAHFDGADVGTHTVTYTVELTGEDAGNYVIDPSNTTTHTEGGTTYTTIDGNGSIGTKDLVDSDVQIIFKPITKVYDTTKDVAYTHTDSEKYFGTEIGSKSANDFVQSVTIGGVTMNFGDDYIINFAEYDSENAGTTGNKATYKLQLIGDKLSNFNLGNLSVTLYDATNKVITTDTTNATTGSVATAIITPKMLQAVVTDTTVVEKTYDNTTNLPITAEDAAAKITIKGALDDSTGIYWDKTNFKAYYADANVAYDSSHNVTTQDLKFDIEVNGTKKTNYVINDSNAQSTTITGTNLGKINPIKLVADFTINERDYNGTTTADLNNTTITLTNSETGLEVTAVSLNKNTIEGNFGSMVDGEFVANGDVNYDANATDKAGYKGVQYTKLDDALAAVIGTKYGNYTIDKTVYFDEAAQKGRIKRLALTMNDIHEKWTGTITKEYDGTDEVLEPTKHLRIYTDKLGTSEDKWVDLAYTLKAVDGAVYDDDQINVIAAKGVTYTLNDLEAKEFQNFSMDELVNEFKGKVYKSTGHTNAADDLYGSITPRVLKINLTTPDGWVKTYDGDTAVKDNAGNEVGSFAYTFASDSAKILDKDTGSSGPVNLVVTGAYEDETANIEPESDSKTGRTIVYTATLSGNTDGNYTLDTTGTKAQGDATESQSAGTGQGAIKKRILYVDFEDGYGSGIDKKYDGDAAADADKTQRNHIELDLTKKGNTGAVDAGIKLKDKNTIEAAYKDKNVARDKQGNVTTQDVYFSNFILDDSGDGKAANYVARANDGTTYGSKKLTGSGTIEPLTVTVALKNAPSKDYDGTDAIRAVDKANSNFTITPEKVVGTENVANYLTIGGKYNDANAGLAADNYGGKGYQYTFTLNTNNYELLSGTDGDRTVTSSNNGLQATLTGSDGVIRPQVLTATVNKVMTKEYDGTTDGAENAIANIGLKGTIVNGDNLGLSAKSVYYDNPDAGKSEDSDELQTHKVTYTLNLSNPNYLLTESTVVGTGTITRKGLTVVATPATINVGEAMPAFTGSVNGLLAQDSSLAGLFTFAPLASTKTDSPGSYGVYGWYSNRISGNLGKNYAFTQASANDNAFTVSYVNTNGNPDTKITPSDNVYNQISKDMSSGFGDNGAAAIEYVDKTGNVIGTSTIDSGEIHGTGNFSENIGDVSNQDSKLADIGIVGGDIVNMEGVDAAGSANIAVSGTGTTVNLEVFSVGGENNDKAGAAEITNGGSNDSIGTITSKDGTINISNTDSDTVELGDITSINGTGSTDSAGAAAIEITGEKQNILEENEDKAEKQEKEGEIAIKSSDGDNDDEIELTVEDNGVNVA